MASPGYVIYPVLLICFVIFPVALLGEASTYEGKTIARIVFVPREQPLDPEELHRILPVKERTLLHLDEVRAAIDRLYASGNYSDIQVDAEFRNGEVVLRFITQNNWFVGRVGAPGQIKEPPTAGQLVNASRLDLGELETPDKMRQGVNGVQQLLQNNGYYEAHVQPRFSYDPRTNQVHIDFVVASGQRARYTAPALVGDLKMPPEKVISATKWKGWLGWKPVTQSRTQHGLENVRKKYQKQDRLMARITVDKMDFDDETKTLQPTLNVRAGPKVEITTVGAKVSRGKLQKFVPVFEEHSVDRDLLVEGQRNLRDYFQSQGYFDAEVEFKAQSVVNDKQVIDYIVNLGSQHKLVKVGVDGNRYFDTQTIRERMFLLPASLQFRRGRYSESYLRRDEEAITNLYQENGFRDVKVTSTVQDDYQGKTGQLAVTVHIDEGPQWIVSKLEVDGVDQLNREKILSTLSSSSGQPFSDFNVAVDRDRILSEYFSQGFPNATFEWSSTPGPAPNRVDVRFVISEGQRRFVRQVLISGLVATRPSLVNKNILLNPGDPLSQPKMVETQRRLYDLGIFSEVDTAIQNPDGDTQNKYVLYQLDEAKKYSIGTGFGAQIGKLGGGTNLNAPAGTTGFSPRFSFDVSRINFRGLGQTLSFRSRLSNLEQLALVNYIVPRLHDNQNLTLSFTTLFDDTKNIHTFDAKREEGAVQLSQKLSRANTVLYRIAYRHITTSNLVIDPLLIPLYSQPVQNVFFAFGFVQDKRDDPTDSHKGIYNTADFGVAPKIFGTQTSFTRFLGRNSTYHPIGKKLVLARSVSFGWLNPITHPPLSPGVQSIANNFSGAASEAIPLAERFFSGGATTLRAFPEFQAGPRDATTGFPVGGQALLIFNTELRFPLIGDNIGGVLFWDMGNVYSRIQDISFRFSQPHAILPVTTNGITAPQEVFGFNYAAQALGFGVRYRTPIGPVRLDLALNPNPTHFAGCAGYSGQQLLQCGLYNPDGTPLLPRKNDRINPFQFFISIGQTF
jgi:outer membrane protein insertion porin family